MAQIFDSEFGRLVRPGAYPSVKVQANTAGLASNGIAVLIGESDGGLPGSLDDFELNYFGPDQLAAVQSKYLSGPIVDMFRGIVAPANDANIVGAVTRVYIYKTNASLQASSSIVDQGIGTYGVLKASNYGRLGNLIYYRPSLSVAEDSPTTGLFSYIPTPSGAKGKLRVSGGASQSFTVSALELPSALVSAADSLSGILAQGGINRDVLTGLVGVTGASVTASGNYATFALPSGSVFAATPVVGDTLLVPLSGDYGATGDSIFLTGTTGQNRGAYVVTAVSNTASSAAITALKVRNSTATTLTAPATKTPITITALTDIEVFSPLVLSDVTGDDRSAVSGLGGIAVVGTAVGSALTFVLAAGYLFAATPQLGDIVVFPAAEAFTTNVGKYMVTSVSNTVTLAQVVLSRLSNGNAASFSTSFSGTPAADMIVLRPAKAGVGKAIEIMDDAGTDLLGLSFALLGTSTAATWISTSVTPILLTSASEMESQLDINRQYDHQSETFVSGGDIALKVGYLGITGTLTVGATTITTTVTGGAGGNLSLVKADYPSLADLVTYINSQAGYSAALGSTLLGTKPPADLDLGTYGICTSSASAVVPGRIKRDLADFVATIAASNLVDFTASATSKGLPDAMVPVTYMSLGALGATNPASIVAAFAAAEAVAANFIVPLFSRDALPLDVADGITDSRSTYTIAGVHTAARSHVLAMSQVKRRKNRQAFLSIRDTFVNAKASAMNMASARVSMCFQDVKVGASSGAVVQEQPWFAAGLAAGMQAAGFYKAIVHKGINASGALQAAGDFSDLNDSQVEDALLSGLLPIERKNTGGLQWTSDQTTYGTDANFVYNSIQAVYVSDIVALSLAERMEAAFIGQTLGDVSAAAALAFIQAVMNEYLRLKLIAPSDDAPAGYKNPFVKIQGGVMFVSMEIKLATALYFIPITFTVSQITQTASL